MIGLFSKINLLTISGVFLLDKNILHPKTKIKGGVMQEECSYLLTSFFEKKRKLDKKK